MNHPERHSGGGQEAKAQSIPPVAPIGHKTDAVFWCREKDAPVIEVQALDDEILPRPLAARILLPGPKGSLISYLLNRGDTLPPHRFAHDSIGYLVSGRVAVMLAGEGYDAHPRDAWAAAAGVEVAIQAADEAVVLEWMAPPHLLHDNRLITWGPAIPNRSHIFTKWRSVQEFELERAEGETRFSRTEADVAHRIKVLVPGPIGALMWNSHRKGKWALHAHGHNWVVYLLKGSMKELFGGGVEFVAGPGDVWAAGPGATHWTEALADNELVEFKWPAPMLWRGIVHSWDRS